MHIPSGISPRQASEENHVSSLSSRALKRERSNAESLSGEPRGAFQIRATDEITPSGNNTVFIIIVRL